VTDEFLMSMMRAHVWGVIGGFIVSAIIGIIAFIIHCNSKSPWNDDEK